MLRLIVVTCGFWFMWVCAAASQEPKEAKPRLDRHGDPLPTGAIARLGTVRFRQSGSITALALSANGKMLVSAGSEDMVRLWDAKNGMELRRFEGHVAGITSVLFGPDEKTLISTDGTGMLRIWDIASGQELRRFNTPKVRVTCLTLAPDQRTLWTGGSDGTVRQWLLPAGIELRQLVGHKGSILALAHDAGGKQILSAGADATARVWDPIGAGESRQFVIGQSFPNIIPHAAFSPNGQLLAFFGGNPPVFRLFDVQEGKAIDLPRDFVVQAATFAFSPSGKIMATGDFRGKIGLWGVASGKELRSYAASLPNRFALAISGNGKLLAYSFGEQSIRLLDPAIGQDVVATAGHSALVQTLCFSRDGQLLLSTARDQSIRVWEPTTGIEIARLHNQPLFLGVLPGPTAGSFFILSSGGVVLWELADKQLREIRRLEKLPAQPSAMALSPDHDFLAVATYDSFIRLFDFRSGAIKAQLGQIKDEPGKKPVRPAANRLAFSPDGKYLAAARFGTAGIEIWNVATRKLIRQINQPRGGNATRLAFSPNGKVLAVADVDLRLYEVATGQERLTVAAPERAYDVAFSPDGALIVAPLIRFGLQLFDVTTGLPTGQPIERKGGTHALALSPDGKFLVTAGADTTALVWDATPLWKKDPPASVQLLANEQDLLWKVLASEDAARAYQALWAFVAARDQAVQFIKKRTRPAAKSIDAKLIVEYIADLDHEKFEVRQKAERELESLGDDAEVEMKAALERQLTLEQSTRLQRLLAKVKGPSPEKRQAIRALEVLEYIGTVQAREVLASLAKGAPGHWQTEQAREAVSRLNSRGE